MFQQLFSKNKTILIDDPPIAEGFHKPLPGRDLLNTPHRQSMIKLLWDITSMTKPVFDRYVLSPIQKYAECVQHLPASESHHHAYSGGMLDHALETACYGLKLRQRHLLPPGAKPEDQSAAGELWNAAIIYGALMHDAAKALVDVEIHLQDGRQWLLWHGNIPGPYRVRYRSGREYNLHSATNPLLCTLILGLNVLDWLMSQPKLFAYFMYTVSGHTERGGIIAELVFQADRASVAKAMGGDPVHALSAPVESIQRKLAEGLRYMVKEQFKLNQKGGVAWLTEEALWLVSPRAINELKAHLYAQGIKNIPADLNRLYGELQAHGLIEEVSEGKSVWKCDVSEGEWKQSFNMIKVSPTLIWPGEKKPAPFGGKLVPRGEGVDDEKPSDADVSPDVPSKQVQEIAAQGEADLSDDILSMFPEITDSKTPSNPTTIPASATEAMPKPVVKHTSSSSAKKCADPSAMITENSGNEPDTGEQFWQWLQDGLSDHSIIINDTKAPVHVVEGTYFLVSPGIFQRFSKKVLGDVNQWKHVQKRFQKLGRHVKTHTRNIHSVSIEGPNKSGLLRGYLIEDPLQVSEKIPPNNWVLKLVNNQEEGGSNE